MDFYGPPLSGWLKYLFSLFPLFFRNQTLGHHIKPAGPLSLSDPSHLLASNMIPVAHQRSWTMSPEAIASHLCHPHQLKTHLANSLLSEWPPADRHFQGPPNWCVDMSHRVVSGLNSGLQPFSDRKVTEIVQKQERKCQDLVQERLLGAEQERSILISTLFKSTLFTD